MIDVYDLNTDSFAACSTLCGHNLILSCSLILLICLSHVRVVFTDHQVKGEIVIVIVEL